MDSTFTFILRTVRRLVKNLGAFAFQALVDSQNDSEIGVKIFFRFS